jgi:hypothetical protein
MRRKLELIAGVCLLLVAFAAIPADWKVSVSIIVGAILTTMGLVDLKRSKEDSDKKNNSFVDKGPSSDSGEAKTS